MKKAFFLIAFVLLLGTVVKADHIRFGKHKEPEPGKGTVEYFSKPFDGIFDAEVTNVKYKDPNPQWRFCNNGIAIMYHNFIHQLYECYYYTVDSGVVRLTGVCVISTANKMEMLPEKPADFELRVESYGENAVLTGREPGDKGRIHKLKLSSSNYISRFENKPFASVMRCRTNGITKSPENLWLVTDRNGAVANTLPNDGTAIVRFDQWDIFQGKKSDDGNFVLVDYIKGRQLYVDAAGVKMVSDEKMLQEVLRNNAAAGLYFEHWQSTFPEKEWKVDTSGYFNGWKAGRLAAEAFLPFMAVMLILLVLNKIYPPFYPNFLFYLTYVVLVFLTLFELWYAISLKQDMFWFIFSPKDFVHGFAAVVGTLVLFCLQIFLILTMEESLGDIYSAYTRCPFWVELVLYGAALYVSIPIMLSDMSLKLLYVYLLLLAACLPTSIGYLIHSRNKVAVLPFLLLCYPLKYIVMLPFLIFYVFKQASSTKVTVASDEDPDHVTVRDMEGNMVNLTRMPNGDMLDNDGHPYLKGGDGSFHPTGVDRTDGPYR